MITSNDLKKGIAIKYEGEIYTVVDFLHVKPGKGGAFVRTKLKSIRKGTVIDRTMNAGEKIEDIRIDERKMQYLYSDQDSLVFMDNESYEQVSVDKGFAGDILDYIKEGDVVTIALYEEKPIYIEPPMFVKLKVTYAEPGLRGDTATNVTKPVKVETGAEFKVPLFVEVGDYIKIDTRKGEYIERVKQ